jgi:predicted ATP-grasp superfamily ATP-dependent carboligase
LNRHRQKWDVLLTNASARVAYTLLRSLARNGLRVGLGVDSYFSMAMYSRYCAGIFRHPSSDRNPHGFMTALRETLLARRPAVYMPADEEILAVAEHSSVLRDLPVRTVIAPFETLRLLDNKQQSLALADALGIPTPSTIRPASLAEITAFSREHPGPLVLKHTRSSGARGVYILQPEGLAEKLLPILGQSARGFEDFIVQEFIPATGYGVSMLFDRGQLKARFTHRRLRERSPSGGPSTLRESVRQPALEAHAERLLRHVGYHGVAMVEFKHDEVSGKSWFLEINPRWWGSLALAVRAGLDFPVLYHRLALGEILPSPPDYKTGVTVRWLLGDLFALTNQCMALKRLPGYGDICPTVDGYDDAFGDDPLPLAAELVMYLRKNFLPGGRRGFGPRD